MSGLTPAQAPISSATLAARVAATGLTVADNKLTLTGSSDATKTLVFQLDTAATGVDVIVDVGAQTIDCTATLPVLTGNRTLAVIDQAQTYTAALTFSSTLAINGNATMGEGINYVLGTTTGTKWGTATTQKQAFWNATPVVQPSGAAQAAVATTGATNTTPYGFTTAAQADAIITLLNEVRSVLVTLGLMKGSA